MRRLPLQDWECGWLCLYPPCFSVASTFPRGCWASHPAGQHGSNIGFQAWKVLISRNCFWAMLNFLLSFSRPRDWHLHLTSKSNLAENPRNLPENAQCSFQPSLRTLFSVFSFDVWQSFQSARGTGTHTQEGSVVAIQWSNSVPVMPDLWPPLEHS